MTDPIKEIRAVAQTPMHPVHQELLDKRTFGEVLADKVVAGIGTWTFLIIQGLLLVVWIVGNAILLHRHPFDPYPFILLNLCLSVQAAVTGPLLLLASNRQEKKDRDLAAHDYQTNIEAKEMVAQLAKMVIELHTGKAPPR